MQSVVPTGHHRVEIGQPTSVDICRGRYEGAKVMRAFGERESMGTTVAGEDIWRGSATTMPFPVAAGEQLEVVSTSVNDTAAGTGTRTLDIHYLDANGDPQEETITMNGTTPVPLVASDVRFVQLIHSSSVGSNGVAVGDITIYKQGSAATIYNMIALGGNMSLVPARMVPRGKKLIITNWHASEAQGKRVNVRLRSTSHDGELYVGTFLFKDVAYLKQTTMSVDMCVSVPALAIVKISGWPDQAGAEVGCGWTGLLFDE